MRRLLSIVDGIRFARRVVRYLIRKIVGRRASDADDPVTQDDLRRALAGRETVTFVQVGSNDGRQGDPIFDLAAHDLAWRGVLIEPVAQVFARLQENYERQPRFTFVNAAIAKKRAMLPFYYVTDKATRELGDLPFWYDQIGSFDRRHIEKHLDGRLIPYIERIDVPCCPLQDVLDEAGIDKLDLVHIDAEGYDFEVLRQLDLPRYRPAVILYEHAHLSYWDRRAASRLLRSAGYRVEARGHDTFATLCTDSGRSQAHAIDHRLLADERRTRPERDDQRLSLEGA